MQKKTIQPARQLLVIHLHGEVHHLGVVIHLLGAPPTRVFLFNPDAGRDNIL